MTMNAFEALSQFLAEDRQTVVWVQNLADPRQLYISPAYQHVWRRDNQVISEGSEGSEGSDDWDETLVRKATQKNPPDGRKIPCWQEMEARKHGVLLDKEWMLRIYELTVPEHYTTYIRDSVFFLYDENNHKVAIGGMAREISQREFCDAYNAESFGCRLSTLESFITKLAPKLGSQVSTQDALSENNQQVYAYVLLKTGGRVKLARSEIRCLLHAIRGESSKAIANTFQISPRTVDKHLQNIREKLDCKTRAELVGKISGFAV